MLDTYRNPQELVGLFWICTVHYCIFSIVLNLLLNHSGRYKLEYLVMDFGYDYSFPGKYLAQG